jgi:hypothetical protein
MKVAKIRNMDEVIGEVKAQVEASTSEILAIFADECMDYVWDLWPAKTGQSIRNLVVNVSPGGSVAIVCPEEHAPYIHIAGERGSALFTRLLPAIENNIDRITDATTRRIERGETELIPRRVDAGLVASKIAASKARAKASAKARRGKMTDEQRRERNRRRQELYRARKG